MERLTKKDLATGDVVTYRNGRQRIVVKDFAGMGDILLSVSGDFRWSSLYGFNDDLTNKSYSSMDIVAVGTMESYSPTFNLLSVKMRWEEE